MRCAAAAAPFRVVSYNVRRFTDKEGGSTVRRIARSLRKLRPSLVCLQEVDLRKRPGALQEVGRELGMEAAFFGHVQGHYGNALLSTAAIRRTHEVALEGGTEVEHPPASGKTYRIHRGMLIVELTVGDQEQPLSIACTHLDHMTEAARRTQMRHVIRELKQLGHPHLLVGDLNALTRADYSDGEWARHEATNAKKGWAAPADSSARMGSLHLLTSEGYCDGFTEVHSAPDSGRGREHRWTAHVDDPRFRIDYIFRSSHASEHGEPALAALAAFVDQKAIASDHFPLVVDFRVAQVGVRRGEGTWCRTRGRARAGL